MAEATPQQIQNYADQRVRPRAEQIRALVAACRDDKAAIDDVYASLTGSQSGWADARTDGPAHLATASDLLAYNTLLTNFLAFIDGEAQYGVVADLCVRPLGSSI